MECHQTLFLVEINLKGNNKEILNFWPKPWTSRFKKKQVFYIERLQTLFIGEMYLKGKGKEISKFWQKPLTDHF